MANQLVLSRSDKWMALSNVMNLAGYYTLKQGVENENLQQIFAVGVPLVMVGGIINDISNYCMIPKNASFLRKFVSIPIVDGISFNGYGLGFLNPIKQISNLYAVAQNTLPKLRNCVGNLSTSPIRAVVHGTVHSFNLGSSLFSTVHSFQSLMKNGDSSDSESKPEENGSGPNTSEKPKTSQQKPQQTKFDHTGDFQRLTDPKLNPKSFKDAKTMLQFPDQKVVPDMCKQYGISYIREACDSVCASIKKTWRGIFLRVHPDKNPGNDLALPASQNLNAAKDTLQAAYGC